MINITAETEDEAIFIGTLLGMVDVRYVPSCEGERNLFKFEVNEIDVDRAVSHDLGLTEGLFRAFRNPIAESA